MPPTYGHKGSIQWGATGSTHKHLAETGTKPYTFAVTLDGDDGDVLTFNDQGIARALKGITSWSFEFSTYLATPVMGHVGLVTFAAGYTVNLDEWSIEIEREEADVTAFGATERAWIPGPMRWRGEFSGFLDTTTPAAMISNANEPASATFKYDERGAVDATLSGTIFTIGATIQVAANAPNRIGYRFRGSGDITQSTPSTGTTIIPPGALGLQDAETVTLTASTGRTYSGSAFWRRIQVRVRVGSPVEVSVSARGTGVLTIA